MSYTGKQYLVIVNCEIVKQRGTRSMPVNMEPKTPEDLLPLSDAEITIASIQLRGVDNGEVIVEGRATFPAATCIRTALTVDDELLPWWPADTSASRDGRRWQLTASIAERSV